MILFLFFQISLKFSICLNWNNVCLAVMITNCLLLYQADPDVLKMDYVKMIMDFFHKKIVSMLRISIFFKVDPPYISSRFFPWPLEIIFFFVLNPLEIHVLTSTFDILPTPFGLPTIFTLPHGIFYWCP